jgi:hypothetical protein
MKLRYPGFNFFFIAALMMILLFAAVINLGRINALAKTLVTPLVSQIQTSQSNAVQPESQVDKIAGDTKNQLQLKDIAQTMTR